MNAPYTNFFNNNVESVNLTLKKCLDSIDAVKIDVPDSFDGQGGITYIHATFQSTMIGFIDDTFM